jgi:hypothetical protein
LSVPLIGKIVTAANARQNSPLGGGLRMRLAPICVTLFVMVAVKVVTPPVTLAGSVTPLGGGGMILGLDFAAATGLWHWQRLARCWPFQNLLPLGGTSFGTLSQ